MNKAGVKKLQSNDLASAMTRRRLIIVLLAVCAIIAMRPAAAEWFSARLTHWA